jgi:hypothetical protein
MARIACALILVVVLGVCPLVAPGLVRVPSMGPAPVLDVPHPPARTAPASMSPARRSPGVSKRSARTLIPSRSTASAAPLVEAPTSVVFVGTAPAPVALALARLAPVAPLAPLAPRAPFALSAPRAALRPAPLVPLYASFATLQGLDYASTRRGLANGGREANPLMRSIVKHPPAFIAVKAAATAGVIVAGEKMWKRNRVGAVLFVAGTTAAMAVVVGRNYAVR